MGKYSNFTSLRHAQEKIQNVARLFKRQVNFQSLLSVSYLSDFLCLSDMLSQFYIQYDET